MTFSFRDALLVTSIALLVPTATFAKPTISEVTPTTATAGVSVNLGASVSSPVPIQSCRLYVDLADVGAMTVSNGRASAPYTFPSGGSRIAFVFCRDTSGGMNSGATTAINVSGAKQVSAPLSIPSSSPSSAPSSAPQTLLSAPILDPNINPSSAPASPLPLTTTPVTLPTSPTGAAVSPDAGKLLKATCPPMTDVNDVCRAVYYIGKDGKRHAFPNSRVFFTWYSGFESVQEIPLTTLSQFELGANVQYRAGVRMVKFTTDPKVYAVSRGGVLHWVTSEALAQAYYGNDWNKKIDDIPDTFYANYTFGPSLNDVADYNPATEFANSKE